jgi:N-dimethylarginine dimethylaminohydrolase
VIANTLLRTRRPEGGTPLAKPWGANSEYGVLRKVLLGPPENLRLLPTSSLSKKSIREGLRVDQKTALAQHREMVSAYEDAGVTVHTLPPDPQLPYQVYARDSSVMTPFGAVVTQMLHPWRRGEYGPVLDFYTSMGIPIYEKITAGSFEGGDLMIIQPGVALCGYSDDRTDENAARQMKGWLEKEGFEVKLVAIDPYYVHIDLMVVMLAEKLAAVCLECLDPRVVEWLKSKDIELVAVPFADTMNLGCNVVSLGKDRVLLPRDSTRLKEKCRALGLKVYDPDISMFIRCGGGVHCMCQALERDPV